jgi:hypothetical protein
LTERGSDPGGFDLQRRAEEVPVADYLALAARLNTSPVVDSDA